MGSESTSLETKAALWTTLRTDRWTQLVFSVFAAATVLYLVSGLSPVQRIQLTTAVGPLIFLSLVVAALISGLDRLSTTEGRFWHDVIAAFGALLIVAALYLVFPQGDRPLVVDLMAEALYAIYYVALVLAAERQPHRTYRWRPTGLERTLAWPAVIAFILALFGYFIVVPILDGSPEAERWISSYALYLALDAYLTVRFLWLSHGARSTRWRTLYLVVGASMSAVFLTDVLELAFFLKSSTTPGKTLDLVYYLPYLAIILTRCRHVSFRDESAATLAEERPETHYTRPSGRTMIHALAFPLLHFGGYSLGLFDISQKPAREILVFWAVLVLGSMAVIQHRVLEKKARELWHDRESVEASLRRNEKDLRLMVERYHTDQKLRLSEEKLAKAFRASPDAVTITSVADGRIKEVNDAFELATGYCREEALGKTVTEAGLWAEPEARQSMIRAVELEGAVRNREVRFRTRSGQIRLGLVSVEKLNIDGEPHLLSVTRDVTERKRIEDKLKTQAVLLDKARDAIAVLDLEDRITYWNRSAERLYGWSSAEALGRPAVELLCGKTPYEALDTLKRVEEEGDWIGELRQRTKDGHEILVESWWTLVRDSDGNPQSKLIITTDLTGRSADEPASLPVEP